MLSMSRPLFEIVACNIMHSAKGTGYEINNNKKKIKRMNMATFESGQVNFGIGQPYSDSAYPLGSCTETYVSIPAARTSRTFSNNL